MELRYYINTTQISEPIGFDDFKTILKRTEQHGVSAESSVGELEFDGVGFGIVQTAYNSDIDTELIFKAEIKCDDNDTVWSELYSGILDLSTYEETYNDYCSCKVKVGEIGVKTTFNNRVDTVVDIERLTSLDGDTLTAYSNIGKEITIPAKGLLLRSKTSQSEDLTNNFNVGSINRYVFPAQDSLDLSENVVILTKVDNTIYGSVNTFNFTSDDNSDLVMYFRFDVSIKNTSAKNILGGSFYIVTYNGTSYNSIWSESYPPISAGQTLNKVFGGYVAIPSNVQVSANILFVRDFNDSTDRLIEFTTKKDSYIKVERIDIAIDTTAKLSLIHETLSRLTEIYSGLTVKSDYYGRSDSNVNPLSNGVGNGALKSILSGLQLRKSLNTDGSTPRVETSFKDMFTELNAIDNIGWGFTTESGINYIRVEDWKWFYKSDYEIMTIDAPANKKRSLRDNVFTRLKIGFNKYGGQDDINSIDTFHTNREYTSGIKAIDKQNNQISKLIADPYAIEFTRRKALDKTTKDWKYDEDLFVLCLKRDNFYNFTVEQEVDDSGDTIISPETMTNFRISPKRNAMRWADRLFELNSAIIDYKFTAGVGNVIAKGEPTVTAGYDYLNDIGGGSVLVENSPIDYVAPYLKPEIISFEYPLTKSEFDDIKADPYGQIVVDGEACYIDEITREVMTGMCEFKLIPKI